MKRTVFYCAVILCAITACGAVDARAAEATVIPMPKPMTTGGKGLMDALSERKSTRGVSDKAVSEQDLSNILWAAWGVNRSDGKRTVPTARNRQNMQVYAVTVRGVFRYDAAKHSLVNVLSHDARSNYGGAPLTLLYAGPAGEMATGMHAGSMYQNVGLYCASVGLANVVKTTGVKELADTLPLPSGYGVVVVQSIGWPK